jgi:GTP cyclohydrolase III
MRIAIVKIEMAVPVVLGDDETTDAAEFDIEENHCPGTGRVELSLRSITKDFEDHGVCAACALGGDNKILTIMDIDESNLKDVWDGCSVETNVLQYLNTLKEKPE